MATNLAFNDRLLRKAMKLGSMRTKRETANRALMKAVQPRQQKKILNLEGSISFRRNWGYKKDRGDRGPGR